jgi:hypothetical protein
VFGSFDLTIASDSNKYITITVNSVEVYDSRDDIGIDLRRWLAAEVAHAVAMHH